uniref:WGS project CAEQ00000000 data, annotated contig 83 n=1 Tax=Trypanosoma congolense (strain IL3000) TaxID=1068625 RepID=F9WIU3_TRYCI|nr:unnamed protein product [Trypanosoma congolense IL3000]
MPCFTVHCAFEAQDDVELTVEPGEVVNAIDDDTHDGWIKVEVLGDKNRVGFVPLSYLTPSSVQGGLSSAKNSVAVASKSNKKCILSTNESTKDYNTMRQPSKSMPYTSRDAGKSSSVGFDHGSSGAEMGAAALHIADADLLGRESLAGGRMSDSQRLNHSPSLLYDTGAVVETFMKNELHLKQLTRRRQEELTKMRSSLEEAKTSIRACRDKKESLVVMLRDLDLSMDRMRKRWKNMLEQEKEHIIRSMSREVRD